MLKGNVSSPLMFCTFQFMVPAIVHISKQRLSSANEGPTVLIMCPTRELCQQIAEVGQSFAHAAGYKMATIYGGAAKGPQIGQLRRGRYFYLGITFSLKCITVHFLKIQS